MGQTIAKTRTFNQRATRLLAAALILSTAGCCCPGVGAARQAARRAQSVNNMRLIIMQIITYHDINNQWPDSLDDVEGIDELLDNPLTGDAPGYEYVKPGDDAEEVGLSQTPILYQLRNGQRDESLGVGYADAHVEMGQ